MAPAQRVGRRRRDGVAEHGQHEALGVPERVPVVARARSGPWPRSPAARPARPPAACGRARSARPAGAPRRRRARRRRPPRTRPGTPPARRPARPSPTCPRPPARRRPGRAPRAASAGSTSRSRSTLSTRSGAPGSRSAVIVMRAEVLAALRVGHRALGALDHVVHARRHPQPAALGHVHQLRAQPVGGVLLAAQRGGERRRRARVLALAAAPARWPPARSARPPAAARSSGSTS